MNRIEVIRVMRKNTYVFVKRVFSTKDYHQFCDRNYDSYKEYRMESEAVSRIFNPRKFANWYFLMEGIQLIPQGYRGIGEMKFVIANRYNTKSYGKW